MMKDESKEENSEDINKIFDDILLIEERIVDEATRQAERDPETVAKILEENGTDARNHGLKRGVLLGAEIGFYAGAVAACENFVDTNSESRIRRSVTGLKTDIEEFRSTDFDEKVDFEKSLIAIRNKFRQLCSLLKLENVKYPHSPDVGIDFCEMMKIERLRGKIDSAIAFLNKYSSLADCHMVEYITDDHFETLLPERIYDDVRRIGAANAADVFWKLRNANRDIEACDGISSYLEDAEANSLKPDDEICYSIDQFECELRRMGFVKPQAPGIKEFMSPKKSHEVQVLSSLVAGLSEFFNCSHAVDIGGGKGYLSTVLTLIYRLSVLNVDCSETNKTGAILRNTKLKKCWPGIVRNNDIRNHLSEDTEELENSYRHVTETIDKFSDLKSLIVDNFSLDKNEDIRLCLTGLHTCGDLGSSIIHLFKDNDYSKVLCGVPCCYHLITETGNDHSIEKVTGFPMSAYLQNLGYTIGRNARMLGCQSLDRLASSQELPTKSLFYRALIEVLIRQRCGERGAAEGRLKKIAENCDSFSEYVKMSAKKLNLESEFSNYSAEYLDNFEKDHERFRKTLDIFYLLRISLAPVVENVILLDRMMFLMENGYEGSSGNSFIVKMFNPVVSPRCYCLVAFKRR